MTRYFSPPDKSYPQILPDKWKFDDGRVVENLQDLSDSELNLLGWRGPIEMPPDSNGNLYEYTWSKSELRFDSRLLELSDDEIQSRVDFPMFIDILFGSIPDCYNQGSDLDYENCKLVYEKIKNLASESLRLNTMLTELIFSLDYAAKGVADIKKIRNLLEQLFLNIQFTEEEISSLRNIFERTGVNHIYEL